MKPAARIVLILLCVMLIASAPFVLSSPNMLGEVKAALMSHGEEDEEEEDLGDLFSLLFLSRAAAEEATDGEVLLEEEVSPEETGPEPLTSEYVLPVDFTVPPAPDPDCFTENGYEDGSIRVAVETLEQNGVTWYVARVEIASATQLRTATAGKLTSSKTARVSAMAEKNNAVVAINGDNFVDNPTKTSFEYRQGQKIRAKANRTKDILIIDENGDFHLFIKSDGIKNYRGKVVNAMTFGPALVRDGELLTVDKEYGYNPNGREPRAALGQTGPLSYVLVIAEGRGESAGVTHQELADFMYGLGCVQAFNLDGGNSAELVFNGTVYKGQPGGGDRSLSDILYFATAIPEETWQ